MHEPIGHGTRCSARVSFSAHAPSPRSLRGLDWFVFFLADVQTGFGPFISVYLTTQGWTQTAIGFALSLGTVTSMVSQVPAGALVDAVRSKRLVDRKSVV